MHKQCKEQMDLPALAAVLADRLPDRALEEIFPDFPPAQIRAVLLGKENVAEAPPAQQTLFTAPTSGQQHQHCRLFTDGASRGNPGQAGAGSTLLDMAGQELAARSQYLGQCTNNVAEYQALIIGLQSALEQGCGNLEIFLDSQLIVRQVLGQYKVKHPDLKPLFADVKALLDKIPTWSITHVPRAQNKRADELANQGIDQQMK